MTSRIPSVTVVIPAYNEESYIGFALEGFIRSSYAGLKHVWIYDGASNDSTVARVSEYLHADERVRLFANPSRTQAHALNLALQQCETELLLRADAHTEYASDYVERCVEAYLQSGAYNVGGAQRFAARTPFQFGVTVAAETFLLSGGAKYRRRSYTGFAETVYLGCFQVAALRRVGGYDTSLRTNEDYELNHRLNELWRGRTEEGGGGDRGSGRSAVYISSNVVCYYYPRASLRLLSRQYYRYGVGRAHFACIHPKGLPFRAVIPLVGICAVATCVTLLSWRFPGLAPILLMSVASAVGSICSGAYLRNRAHLRVVAWRGKRAPAGVFAILCSVIIVHCAIVAYAAGFFREIASLRCRRAGRSSLIGSTTKSGDV